MKQSGVDTIRLFTIGDVISWRGGKGEMWVVSLATDTSYSMYKHAQPWITTEQEATRIDATFKKERLNALPHDIILPHRD